MDKIEEIKQIIDEQKAKGNIVVATFEGLKTMPLADFVEQDADGILYDLNRSEIVIYTLAKSNPDDLRWINDFAVAQVISELKRVRTK